MERFFKWLTPALILAEAVLVWSGLVDLRAAAGLVAGIEVLLVLAAGRPVIAVILSAPVESLLFELLIP